MAFVYSLQTAADFADAIGNIFLDLDLEKNVPQASPAVRPATEVWPMKLWRVQRVILTGSTYTSATGGKRTGP